MNVLERPAALHQFAGEPIEQLGMRRHGAVVAEIRGSVHDAATEMVMPDAVHDDSCGERILGPRDPASQRDPPLLLGRRFGNLKPAEQGHRSGANWLARQHRIASKQPMHGRRLLEAAAVDDQGRLGRRAVAVPDSGEDGLDRIEIPLRNGVEFVIVAFRTTEREREEGGPRGVDHVGQFVETLRSREHNVGAFDLVAWTADEETRGGILANRVAGNLLEDESVIGLVGVQGVDDIVAIMVGIAPLNIRLEAVGFGEAHHVEPVSSPALPKMRAAHDAVDQPFPRERMTVREEIGHLARRRRQAEHVEIKPANLRAPIGLRGRTETACLQLRRNERVDGV